METAENQQQITDDFSDEDKVTSDLKLWNYKEEKELIGVVVAIDEEGNFGRTIIVDTSSEQGLTIPSLTALNTKLRKTKIGDKVKIVCLGLVRGKNKRDYYDFDVFVK
jgi:hypothetical protein|tara:strand:- start:4012 stop:4335 length:324 start_codon:yes stop_codon:yes gene_type:complete